MIFFSERSRQTDSDSDNSVDGRSLELASSHSSDDDVSSRQHRSATGQSFYGALSKKINDSDYIKFYFRFVPGNSTASNYLPNICEGVIQAPPALNVISQSDLFPNLAPLYAPRWSSQIPQTYIPSSRKQTAFFFSFFFANILKMYYFGLI